MNPVRLIERKRDGQPLTDLEWGAWIEAYLRDEVADTQMAAMAMAVTLRGMDAGETAALARVMAESGRRLPRVSDRPRVDKHSTGGVGDKVSLVLAPALAACGMDVPMISGRGLGATGGTLDKLESIAGFRADLSFEEISRVTREVGCVITGTTPEIAPADARLYALRDITGTVKCVPLITASILSKKLAEDLDALVFDVKYGPGALMKREDEARALAASLVDTGRQLGAATGALLSPMEAPLGRCAGLGVEVDEALACLRGQGPADLRELVLALGSHLLGRVEMGGNAERLGRALDDGSAAERFERMVRAQGGDLDRERPRAPLADVPAEREGWVRHVAGEDLGWLLVELGGGRTRPGDAIDPTVGLVDCLHRGERVERGAPLCRIHAPRGRHHEAVARARAAFELQDQPSETGHMNDPG